MPLTRQRVPTQVIRLYAGQMSGFDVGRLVVPQSGLDDPSHESDSNSLQSSSCCLTPAVHWLLIVSVVLLS